MGWVVFEKIYEDEDYIVYKYSHDCYDMDGIIIVKKVFWYRIDLSKIWVNFSDEEQDEIFRVILGGLDEDPNVNKRLWQEYSEKMSENNRNYEQWRKNCVIEKYSDTDFDNGHFAEQVILYISKICSKEEWNFPDRYSLNYG